MAVGRALRAETGVVGASPFPLLHCLFAADLRRRRPASRGRSRRARTSALLGPSACPEEAETRGAGRGDAGSARGCGTGGPRRGGRKGAVGPGSPGRPRLLTSTSPPPWMVDDGLGRGVRGQQRQAQGAPRPRRPDVHLRLFCLRPRPLGEPGFKANGGGGGDGVRGAAQG